MRYAIRFTLIAAAISLLAGLPVRAQQVEPEVQLGPGLICDTQKQVERYVALFDGDAETTIVNVNSEEHDPTACVVAMVAYVVGQKVSTVRNSEGTFNVVRILVLGAMTEQGLQATAPGAFFSIVKVDERDA